MEDFNDYSEIHDYYENYNWNTGEQDLNVFTGAELNDKLEMSQVANDLQNHLVFDHSYTDNLSIALSVFNLAMIIFILYKLNTKSNG